MKSIFGMQINIDIFGNLIVSFWLCVVKHAQSTQNKRFPYLCKISRKAWGMKLIFYLQINTKVSVSKYPKNKFAISLQYLKKEVIDEVDFLHADKHESLIQIETMVLMGMAKHSQSSQNSKFAMSLQYL